MWVIWSGWCGFVSSTALLRAAAIVATTCVLGELAEVATTNWAASRRYANWARQELIVVLSKVKQHGGELPVYHAVVF